MSYRPPAFTIDQEFLPAPAVGATPLYACIMGPQFALHRYAVASEKARLGAYDADAGITGPWPNHVAGGIVEKTSAKAYIEAALLRYFAGSSTGYLTSANGRQLRTVGYSGLVFKTTAAANRSGAFGTRDVQVGDIVDVSWNDSGAHTKRTRVSAIVAEAVAGTSNPTATRTAGAASTVAAASATACPTNLSCTYDYTGYDGLRAGYPQDVYTITVTRLVYGGVGGLDGTVLRLVSAGGDAVTVTLGPTNHVGGSSSSSSSGSGSGSGYYIFSPGTRGGVMTVALNGLGELAVGDSWVLTLSQTYTRAAVPTITGTYAGLKNTQYLVTVIAGGLLGGAADTVLAVTSVNGADATTPITIPAGASMPVAVPIGNNGLTLHLAALSYCTGDVFAVDAAAPQAGACKTLLFQDSVLAAANTVLSLALYVSTTVQIPAAYVTFDDMVVVDALLGVTSSLLGTPATYSLFEGDVYIDYREQQTATAGVLQSLGDLASADALIGPDSPLNPLGKGVRMAFNAAAGQPVYFIALASDDVDGYTAALDSLTESLLPYSIVPLTTDEAVKELVYQHVLSLSDLTHNQWRICWLSNDRKQLTAQYTQHTDHSELLATVAESTPSLYNQVEIADGLLQTATVRPGDKLRINYATQPDGSETFDAYTIDRVLNETQLLTLTPLPAPISVGTKVEIWRQLTVSEYAQFLAAYPATYNHRRVRSIWADNPVELDGTPTLLCYVAAALAGLRSGVAPHAPVSNITVPGVTLDPLLRLGSNNLNLMAAGGNWLVVKDHVGRVYTRHQLTTIQNPDDLRQREDSTTTNLDSISYDFKGTFQSVVGQSNVSPAMLSQLSLRFIAQIDSIVGRNYPDFLGPQMLNAKLLKLAIHPVYKDTVEVAIDPDMPYPLNGLNIVFTVNS